MIYILETELNEDKFLHLSLQTVYGIGKYQSIKICKKLGYNPNIKLCNMSFQKQNELKSILEKENSLVSSELKLNQKKSLANLIEIKAYKGLRSLKNLPIRGQRTKTNARTTKRKKPFQTRKTKKYKKT